MASCCFCDNCGPNTLTCNHPCCYAGKCPGTCLPAFTSKCRNPELGGFEQAAPCCWQFDLFGVTSGANFCAACNDANATWFLTATDLSSTGGTGLTGCGEWSSGGAISCFGIGSTGPATLAFWPAGPGPDSVDRAAGWYVLFDCVGYYLSDAAWNCHNCNVMTLVFSSSCLCTGYPDTIHLCPCGTSDTSSDTSGSSISDCGVCAFQYSSGEQEWIQIQSCTGDTCACSGGPVGAGVDGEVRTYACIDQSCGYCIYSWNAADATWVGPGNVCSDPCACSGPPGTDGLFDGESRITGCA